MISDLHRCCSERYVSTIYHETLLLFMIIWFFYIRYPNIVNFNKYIWREAKRGGGGKGEEEEKRRRDRWGKGSDRPKNGLDSFQFLIWLDRRNQKSNWYLIPHIKSKFNKYYSTIPTMSGAWLFLAVLCASVSVHASFSVYQNISGSECNDAEFFVIDGRFFLLLH